MLALITVIVSFLLTGLIGNWLVQRWQQRNWWTQHTLQANEKNLEVLRTVAEDILKLADARIFRTRRVVWQLIAHDEDSFACAKREYVESIKAWNDRFNSLCVNLTMFGNHSFARRLEERIQPRFVEVSEKVDEAIRAESKNMLNSEVVARFQSALDEVSGLLWKFSRDLLRLLLKKREEAYSGKLIPFCGINLELFSTWYLFKALFKAREELQPISSTSLDPNSPFFSRPEWPWIYQQRS